ncbi:MAG: M50 family metallopeptidase [Actinomycetota bacterium]
MGAFGIVAFVVAVLVMVLFHEFGHFITARKFGIKVEEFFIGFGPRIFSVRKGETEYGLKAILLGGYVRIAGMNPFQEIAEADKDRVFGAKPAWQRAIVLVAGSFTHFILATLIFTILFSTVGVHDFEQPLPQLQAVDLKVNGKPGPGGVAGLKVGDRVVGISGKPVRSWEDIRKVIRTNPGNQIIFEVKRGAKSLKIPVTPVEARVPESAAKPANMIKAGQIGVAPDFKVVRESPPAAFWHGLRSTGLGMKDSVKGIGQIFSPSGLSGVFKALGASGDRPLESDQPVGLVGGARLAGQATSAGAFEALIQFLAVFIVFVGVINLAPLPPLDGGHLAVLAFEKISGKKVDMRKVIPVAGAVVAFFVVLSMALLYLDIFRPISNPFQ